jgi:hypothetical protein
LGAELRIAFIPFMFGFGNLGAELQSAWHKLEGQRENFDIFASYLNFHLNVLYQRMMFENRLAINVRAGAGTTIIYDVQIGRDHFLAEGSGGTWVMSWGGGISAQLFFLQYFYLDIGVDFYHIITNDNPQQGYIRPAVGIGGSLQ